MEYEQEALNLIARRRRGKQTTRHSCSTFSFSLLFFPLLPLPSFFLFFIFIFLFLFFGIYCFNNSSNAVGCKWHGGSRRVRDPSRICIILSVRNISVENTVENYYVALLLISKIFWKVYQFIILSKNYLIRFEVLKSIFFFFFF